MSEEGNMDLASFFKENPEAAIGFSGGVDSSYLLYAAVRYAKRVRAYYVKSAFQPAFELLDARRLAAFAGAKMTVLPADILSFPEVAANPGNRCYFCKKQIFGTIAAAAQRDGFHLLCDGTNASDAEDDRPGMRALKEMNVLSPLRLAGLTKTRIRKLSKEAGLFTWDKPAYACLATRIPENVPITEELLVRVESAENILFDLGFRDFRVRVFHGAARIQLSKEDFGKAFMLRNEIEEKLKAYFSPVLLDLSVRRT